MSDSPKGLPEPTNSSAGDDEIPHQDVPSVDSHADSDSAPELDVKQSLPKEQAADPAAVVVAEDEPSNVDSTIVGASDEPVDVPQIEESSQLPDASDASEIHVEPEGAAPSSATNAADISDDNALDTVASPDRLGELEVFDEPDIFESNGEDEQPLPPPVAATRIGPSLTTQASQLSAKQRLLIAVKPRLTRAQILTALLLGLLGFALVVQLQLSQKDELAGLRQSELINLLDEVTRRTDDLEAEERRLNGLLDELNSGRNTQEIAREAAEQDAQVQGILSGRLPAVGPGVKIEVEEGERPLKAQVLFNILEELRNAGAEAVELNGVRLVASSYFAEESGYVTVSGQRIESPFIWYAIGDPNTISPALEIPGGAMPSVRSGTGSATVTPLEEVNVSAVTQVREPEFAVPDEGTD